jgi:hypothetical protein
MRLELFNFTIPLHRVPPSLGFYRGASIVVARHGFIEMHVPPNADVNNLLQRSYVSLEQPT